jgi:hypothetical protein
MSFIERERDRIEAAMRAPPISDPAYPKLRLAKQALSWSLDPLAFVSPLQLIRWDYSSLDIHQDGEDCRPLSDPVPS